MFGGERYDTGQRTTVVVLQQPVHQSTACTCEGTHQALLLQGHVVLRSMQTSVLWVLRWPHVLDEKAVP
jgi:hypothetical protein